MIHQNVSHPSSEVDSFQGLLVDYTQQRKANTILRGLRAISDFEFEFQLAHMNQRLSENTETSLDTVFMMTSHEHSFVSSRLVREIASFQGNVSDLAPPKRGSETTSEILSINDTLMMKTIQRNSTATQLENDKIVAVPHQTPEKLARENRASTR